MDDDDPTADPGGYKPGTIKSIKLVNFMCHNSFELALGPRVNFIIGPNGSGKSALLTALVVALGGRASTTSRAKSNSELVMYGKKQAKIVIVIHNYEKIFEKDKAFKPDDYGKFIIVEKSIFRDEVAKLVLKNDKEKKVSERKQELDDMLEHFGILINNPICVLNQEISKTFLHSKRPEDKFDLFMKATLLEQIQQDYASAKQSHKDWDDCNSRSSIAFKLLDAEYESCKEKTSFLENRAKLNDHLENLNLELIWAFTAENEKASEELSKKLQEINDSIDKSQKIVECRMEKIRQYDEDLQVFQESINTIKKLEDVSKKKLHDIVSKETDVKERQVLTKTEIDRCQRKIARYEMDVKSCEKSIADMKRQFQDQNSLDQNSEQRKIEMENLERKIVACQAKEKSTRRHTEQLSESMTSLRSELHEANMRTNSLKGKLSSHEAMLRRLKNGQENHIRRFGDFVIRIREEIDRAHEKGRFRSKPLGPVGYYLKLKSSDIAGPLEVHLGKNAHAFVCDNTQDMSTLNSIFKKMADHVPGFRAPSIICRAFVPRHNITRFRAHHDEYKTLLDYLEVEEDPVYNVLVDRTSLEQVLFIPDYATAEGIMINPALVPKYTRCAYTKDNAVMHPRTAHGGYKSLANNGRYTLFTENSTAQISQMNQEINLIKAELRDAEGIVKSIQDNLAVQRREYESNNAEIRKVIQEIRQMEERLLGLKTTITIEPQELIAMEGELEIANQGIAVTKVELDKLKETLAIYQSELDDLGKEKKECKQVLNLRDEEKRKVINQITSTRNSRESAQGEIKERNISIEHKNEAKKEQQKKLDVALDRLARSKQNIPDLTRRPSKIRKTDEIKEEIRKIELQIKVESEDMRDPEELLASLRKRMAEIDNITALKNANLNNFTLGKRSLQAREEGLQNLRTQTVHAVSNTFATVMRAMKMNGELRIHLNDIVDGGEVVKKAGTLEMRIDTNHTCTPSQRVGLGVSDSNCNTHGMNGPLQTNGRAQRRVSSSQPPLASGAARAKRARADADGNTIPDLSGQGKENASANKMTDTRSLSGGERSFSTVAFVLSLWHHCQSPFKLMDEIDVFMDMVTRRVSYNALIRFAERSDDDPGQFIFFSPLELPKFDSSASLVKVYEMPVIVRQSQRD